MANLSLTKRPVSRRMSASTITDTSEFRG